MARKKKEAEATAEVKQEEIQQESDPKSASVNTTEDASAASTKQAVTEEQAVPGVSETDGQCSESADVSEKEPVSAPSSGAETETTVEAAEEKPTSAPVQIAFSAEPRIISTYYNEINRRLGDRVRISKAWHSRPLPALGDSESKSEFDKQYKESTKLLRHSSYAVNEDMKCLSVALANIQIDYPGIAIGEYVDKAYYAVPRPPEPVDEEEDETPSVKKGKDLPGQQKLQVDGGKLKVKDDGSTAEAAGDCTTRPLVEGEDVTAVEEEPVDEEVREATTDVLNSLTIELVNEIQSMTRESAEVVLQEHIAANFPEIAEQSDEATAEENGEYTLAEIVIAAVLREYPPKADAAEVAPEAIEAVAESGKKLTETFNELGEQIKELGKQKAELEKQEAENWDEPQRKEPEEEPVADELSKKRGKKGGKKKEADSISY